MIHRDEHRVAIANTLTSQNPVGVVGRLLQPGAPSGGASRKDASDRGPAKSLKLDIALGVLRRTGWNFSRTARILRIQYPSNLRRTLSRLETAVHGYGTSQGIHILRATLHALLNHTDDLPAMITRDRDASEQFARSRQQTLRVLLDQCDPSRPFDELTSNLFEQIDAYFSARHPGAWQAPSERLKWDISIGVLRRTGWGFVQSAGILNVEPPSMLRAVLGRLDASSDVYKDASSGAILSLTLTALLDDIPAPADAAPGFAAVVQRVRARLLHYLLAHLDGSPPSQTSSETRALRFATIAAPASRASLCELLGRITSDQRPTPEELYEPSLLEHIGDWFTGELMLELLTMTAGNVSKVARMCGREYRSLTRTLQRLGIAANDYRQ